MTALRAMAFAVGVAWCSASSPSLAGQTVQQQVEEGRQAIARGDYPTALRLVTPAAQQGNAEAQNALGVLYSAGWGVPQDYTEAVAWFRKAAEQGHAKGQYNYGRMFDNGHGVTKDEAEAAAWYRKSAEQGYRDKFPNLASVAFANGRARLLERRYGPPAKNLGAMLNTYPTDIVNALFFKSTSGSRTWV